MLEEWQEQQKDWDFSSLSILGSKAQTSVHLSTVLYVYCGVIGSSWNVPDITAMEYPCSMLMVFEPTLCHALESVSDTIKSTNW